ncbi:MAG: hypothetical protein AAFO72_08570 [Pseudomonadota bacterium]
MALGWSVPYWTGDWAFRALVDRVMARQSDRIYVGDAERLQMFAGLVNPPRPNMHVLARCALDGANCAGVWGVSIPKRDRLRQEIAGVEDELCPIRILLAGSC